MKPDKLEVTGRRCRFCGIGIQDPPGLGRGQWRRFCNDECRDQAQAAAPGTTIRSLRSGDAVPDGPPRRYRSAQGYIRLRWQIAPRLLVEVYEHRVQDGKVVDDEHVHHINHQPDDNRPENLVGLTAQEHADLHSDDRRAPWHAIAQMYEAGATQPHIAKTLGVDNSTVSRALRHLGMPARTMRDYLPLPSEQATRDAYAVSTSAPDLAARLGIAVNTARVAMKQYGLASFPAGRRKEQRRSAEAQEARAHAPRT